MERKSLTVDIRKIEGGYEISFRLPPEVIFTQALHRGFESDGQTARVRIDSIAIIVNPKAANWLIHHEDRAGASPEIVG